MDRVSTLTRGCPTLTPSIIQGEMEIVRYSQMYAEALYEGEDSMATVYQQRMKNAYDNTMRDINAELVLDDDEACLINLLFILFIYLLIYYLFNRCAH
jgi:hypothetical protein